MTSEGTADGCEGGWVVAAAVVLGKDSSQVEEGELPPYEGAA